MPSFLKIKVLSAITFFSASVTLLGLQGCAEIEKFQKTSAIVGKASSLAFDPVKWKSDKTIRDQMCGGLSITLKGMTVDKVKQLLGNPDSSKGDTTSPEGQTLTWDMQTTEGKTHMYLNAIIINGAVDRIEMSMAK